MQWAPHQIQNATKTITAATSAPSAVQVPNISGQSGPCQYVITNQGANDVGLGIGMSATEATANAASPTAVSGTNPTRIILARSQITITANANAFFTGMTASGTSIVTIEPGEGV